VNEVNEVNYFGDYFYIYACIENPPKLIHLVHLRSPGLLARQEQEHPRPLECCSCANLAAYARAAAKQETAVRPFPDGGAAGGSMKLTDQEREEFIALAQDTFDPELWTEDDLPLLRASKKEFEEAQRREGGDVPRTPTEFDNRDDGAGGSPAAHDENR